MGSMKDRTNGAQDIEVSENQEEDFSPCAAAPPVGCFTAALRLITGKWKGDILWHLSRRTLRFGELMRRMPGITQHMLTAQLRDLENHGLVTRTVYAEVPPRVEYALTPAAVDLREVFAAIRTWSVKHADTLNLAVDEPDIEEPPRRPTRARAG